MITFIQDVRILLIGILLVLGIGVALIMIVSFVA